MRADNASFMKRDYLNQLTWIRGIAALLVVISHVVRATEVTYTTTDETQSFWFLSLFDLGSFGVLLFFALSGCTLYISTGGSIGKAHIHKFYLKRFFRIWPAFAISLLAYISFSFVFQEFYNNPQGLWIEKQFIAAYTLYDFASYISMTFNFTGEIGLFNNAYWSLPVEFQYYLLLPLLLVALRATGILGPAVIGAALYFLPSIFQLKGIDSQVFVLAYSFCGGVVIGHIHKHWGTYNKIENLNPIYLLLSFLLVTLVSNNYLPLPDLPFISNKWNFFSIMALVITAISIRSRLSLPAYLEQFLGHYGTISYSTYLYHNLCIGVAVLLLINYGINSPIERLAFTLSFTLITTYMLALASYNWVEKPFVQIGRRLAK